MNDRTDSEALERVLDAYAASTDGPSHASLVEWIRRYPQYERELTEFAIAWGEMEHLPAAPRSHVVETETLVLRGMSIFRNMMHSMTGEQEAEPPFESIVAEARRRGLSPRDLASRLELNLALVRKLDLRRIAYSRIPDRLMNLLATVIGRTRQAIDTFLQGPPALALNAQHRANQPPSAGAQEDFFDAVRAEASLNEEWRNNWLALEPPADTTPRGEPA